MELMKIINAKQTLEGLAERSDMNAHLAYWMTKFVMKTQHEHDFYIAEMRKLIDKYSEPSDGQEVRIAPESVSEFNAAVDALAKTDVEAPDIKFSLSEISKELKLSMKQMYPLMDFIDENK